VDERLTSHAVVEGVDDIGVGDIGELILLLGEALDVLPKGLIGPLLAITRVLRCAGPSVRTLEVPNEG
jgi:hypothetical protein